MKSYLKVNTRSVREQRDSCLNCSQKLWLTLFAVLCLLALIAPSPASSAPCDVKSGFPFVDHDTSSSYCELCGYSYVTVVISNPYSYTAGALPTDPDVPGAVMTDIVLVENLGASGLEFASWAPTPITYQVNGGGTQNGIDTGLSGSALSFTSAEIPALASLASNASASQVNTISIRFAVARSVDPEGLISADRQIEATISFDTYRDPADPDYDILVPANNELNCGDSPQDDLATLPLREPIPQITKTGWNVDAGQDQGSATDPVYAMDNDDIVWRIQIDNIGNAELQDLRFDDLMDTGSLVVNYVCTTEGAANSIALNNGAGPAAGCTSASNSIDDYVVANPIAQGGSLSVYLVGKASSTASCQTNRNNTVDDVQWGCDVQAPVGGIAQTSGGTIPYDQATLYTRYNDDHPILTVERHLTGVNTSQPVGSRGMMTIIIRNTSGGSVNNIQLDDVLPAEYVVDTTFDLEVDVTPAYGASYSGLVDAAASSWNFVLNEALGPKDPHIDLLSSSAHSLYPDQVNMLRNGDVAVVRFRVVLIESDYYDRQANLDVNPEVYPGTDPTYQTPLNNELTVNFDVFCTSQGAGGHYQLILNGNGNDSSTENVIPAFPEDLDIQVGGAVFILTNDQTQILTLPIQLTNNGGHDAEDYHAFVTFGATMNVIGAPAGCSQISLDGNYQPAPWKVWLDPIHIPETATVYECTAPAVIAPNQTVTYNFDVIKSTDPVRIALDDLSLRADVVGEITLYDDSLLAWPAPIIRADGETDRANNYSLDATWARVIGFNLKKAQIGTCNENNPPTLDGSGFEEVQIGEECSFTIETGGWFGFQTPGYAYIAVQDIQVVDNLPDGQAYISSSDPYTASTAAIQGISVDPAGLAVLDEGNFGWIFNVPDSQRIQVADEWFVVDTTSRLLNKEVDVRAAPNLHATDSANVLTSTFHAIFSNVNTGSIENYTLGPSTVGYPIEQVRRVDLRVTEPLLTLVKEACNETLYGYGPACSNFTSVVDDGDAYTSYIYRIRLTNEATAGGYQRAPAYDVIVTDQLDATDLAYVLPFNNDGLNNDGDASTDGADAGGEGTISDNTVKNSIPAELTFSYTHSSALQQIDPGQSVDLYYRVNYDDDAAPLQTFTNSAVATYDSLTGASGSQTVSPQLNSTLGGARFYTSDVTQADVTIMPIGSLPKTVIATASTPLVVPAPQHIVPGEELEYQLETLLPVAQLREFVIRDNLPAGLRCADAPVVDLDAAPYSAAGFDPGGQITPTCADDYVEWVFGDQRLTNGNGSDRFDFAISFIAQVQNSVLTNAGDLLANGHPVTVATVQYRDETNVLVSYDYSQADVTVAEPQITLVQFFSVAETDASDTVRVTVTATNGGTATAYNLEVLVPLTATSLSYSGTSGGLNPPDQVDLVSLGADQPIFSWNAPNGIAVGDTISFTFDLIVATDVQPHQVLETTLQARWTSLQDQTVALNSTGTIDSDGTINGMRTGSLPNAGNPINDYETAATAALTVAVPSVAKTDQSPSLIPTIGAHKQFRLVLNLPEGVTADVALADSLDAAGISYLFSDNADFPISYTFSGIQSINGNTTLTAAAFNSSPADGSSGIVTWDIGSVTTLSEDDSSASAISPAIQIDYYARVNNDLVTDAGDQLQNEVAASYLNFATAGSETLTVATASVTVSEPNLTLNKTLANVTLGKGPSDSPVAGDTIEYQLILLNNGSTNSTAQDINIVDSMPAGLVLDGSFSPTATINSVPVIGFVAAPTIDGSNVMTWGRDNGDATLDLPAGQMLVITYHATVNLIVDPSGLIENGVWSDWTSLDDVSVYERTGDGCPTITAPDDYCVGPVYASTIGIAPALDLQKSVINQTTGANPGSTASPGDVLRYRIQVTSISAAAAAYSLQDEIDQLNASAYFVPGSMTMLSVPSGTDNSSATGGAAGTGLIDLSNLTLNGWESALVEFTLQLAPVIADGTAVLNQAELTLFGYGSSLSDDPNISGSDNPTRTTIISAPQWQFEKIVDDLTGASSVLLPGDQLRYTISIKNVGSENALNVLLRDAIPANTTYLAGTTTLNGVSVADPAAGVSALEAGMLINAPEDTTPGSMRADADAAADNLATISFDVVVNGGVAAGTAIANQAYVNGDGEGSGSFSNIPSDDPATATAYDPTVVWVSGIDFTKSVYNLTQGSDGATASPGDLLRYRLTLTNTGSTDLSALAISDELEALQSTEPVYFVPGSLTLTAQPSGSDASATTATGGVKGTGLVEVSSVDVAAGASATVEFTILLAPVITSGTDVLNQASLAADGTIFQLSDSSDTSLPGTGDPTVTTISSAPEFVVEKTSTFLGADPAVLMAGDRLRYTISVRNIGDEDAVAVLLRDDTPASTSYVAGSTTLNGSSVADASGGINPLHAGILIHSPDNASAGLMTADSSAAANNTALISFDVVVDSDAMDGLIIENQAFVSASGAGSGAQTEQPSDDPATPEADDPTRDVVGNLPLLYALKTVSIVVDNGTAGIVDPGDILEYQIIVTNTGAIPATGVILTDTVPANTTYVADSTALNWVSLGSDGGVLPLVAGFSIQSGDNPGAGIISTGESAAITFNVRVNGGVATGTLISNQGTISSSEQADLLTDADGVPGNGYQPTLIAVGDVQLLSIVKAVAVAGGGSAEPGSELIYTIRVRNAGLLPATLVSVVDDLSAPPLTDQLSYVSGSGVLDGLTTGVSFSGNVLNADYTTNYGELAAGDSFVVRFHAQIDSALAYGTTVTNSADVLWNSPQQSATATVSIDVGGTPGAAALNGTVWHDANYDLSFDNSSEAAQENWTVELYLGGSLVATTVTDSDGSYQLTGLVPSVYTTGLYELYFISAGAGSSTALLGSADSLFTNGMQSISDIDLPEASNLQNLNMPLWPNGVVYNSIARTPVAGATLTMLNATGTLLPGSCFDDPNQQGQVTTLNGFYKFDLNFSQASCPSGGAYLIDAAAPASGYFAPPSVIIPPASDASTLSYSVPDCLNDAMPAVPYCQANASAEAPEVSVAAASAGTTYYQHLTYASADIPGDSQIFYNGFPIDPELDGAVAITKKAEITSVTKGTQVPYTITVNNVFGAPLDDMRIVDRFPAGFKYVAGSALLDGVQTEPVISGRSLSWSGLELDVNEVITIRLLLIVGAGVGEGEYVNRAQVYNTMLDTAASGEATATVRVIPDPDFDCTDIIGKVYDDRNMNGSQDPGENGLAGARVATAQGLLATTDQFGRYHITCAVVPDQDIGSNFIMKLDDRSLPSGYRVVSENPRVQRATRGKMMKFNFGATLHRTVSIDIADAAFEPGTTVLRLQWRDKLDQLLGVLKQGPAILRLSYLGDVESQTLAEKRLASFSREIEMRWNAEKRDYVLNVEKEFFWRRGAPVGR